IFLYSTASVSFCANSLLLLLLLLHRSGLSLGNYRILLIVFALSDVFISIYHVWYIPMFCFTKYGLIYYGYGCLLGRGTLSKNCNTIFTLSFYLPFFLIGIHFIYRYLSLTRPSVVKENFFRFLSLCTGYAISYNLFFIFFTAHPVYYMGISKRFYGYLAEYEQRPLRPDMNVAALEYIDEDSVINSTAIWIVLGAGIVGGHLIVVSLVCIYKIVGALNERVLDIAIKRVHIQLFRALLLQFAMPFIFSFLPYSVVVLLPAVGVSLDHVDFARLSFSGSI
ncbi:hypothetical protein PENTCL1PPCAC_16040, partial [Pristionchus entomophagus]